MILKDQPIIFFVLSAYKRGFVEYINVQVAEEYLPQQMSLKDL